MRRFMPTFSLFFLVVLCMVSLCAAADVPSAVKTVTPYLLRIETIGGHEKVGSEFANEGTSTGILLDQEGFVLTAAFNFLHDPTSILLVFPDGTKKAAVKIATDRLRMLTLLKAGDFEGKEPAPMLVRSKESIRIGERCIAVGVVFSAEPNVTLGIISGKDRIWGKAIQTDAAIGPNNYGGLLVGRDGKVLGIPVPLSMMAQEVAAGAEMYDAGLGMAIPWEDALALLPKLKEGKDLLPGFLGFGFKDNQAFIGQPVIAVVRPDSPAADAGLKIGDQIVKIDNVQMPTALAVTKNIRQRYVGETLAVTFMREGTERTVSLTAVENRQ